MDVILIALREVLEGEEEQASHPHCLPSCFSCITVDLPRLRQAHYPVWLLQLFAPFIPLQPQHISPSADCPILCGTAHPNTLTPTSPSLPPSLGLSRALGLWPYGVHFLSLAREGSYWNKVLIRSGFTLVTSNRQSYQRSGVCSESGSSLDACVLFEDILYVRSV